MNGRTIQQIRRFLTAEDGPTMVEYATMLGIIAIAIIGALLVLGDMMNLVFTDNAEAIDEVLQED